jgi:hypothetical protein
MLCLEVWKERRVKRVKERYERNGYSSPFFDVLKIK